MAIPIDQAALIAPITAHPGYLIDTEGNVYSRLSGELRPIKLRQTRRGRLYVYIYDVNGRRQYIGIKKLLTDTFVKDES